MCICTGPERALQRLCILYDPFPVRAAAAGAGEQGSYDAAHERQGAKLACACHTCVAAYLRPLAQRLTFPA